MSDAVSCVPARDDSATTEVRTQAERDALEAAAGVLAAINKSINPTPENWLPDARQAVEAYLAKMSAAGFHLRDIGEDELMWRALKASHAARMAAQHANDLIADYTQGRRYQIVDERMGQAGLACEPRNETLATDGNE